ncbi:hypothetical protein MUK42_30176 [Musa troglodytarum]|uniref:Uncharacterized protein n=1 Tax=Musa troglodytarum TaxID=320322 RepID=A0A9E7HPD1_9LILI|nr:hypothetical protein MUK42_30176 [Musa troglodytarum]
MPLHAPPPWSKATPLPSSNELWRITIGRQSRHRPQEVGTFQCANRVEDYFGDHQKKSSFSGATVGRASTTKRALEQHDDLDRQIVRHATSSEQLHELFLRGRWCGHVMHRDTMSITSVTANYYGDIR